jgi:hypothetical protein
MYVKPYELGKMYVCYIIPIRQLCMYFAFESPIDKKKVKVFRYKPEVALGVPGG